MKDLKGKKIGLSKSLNRIKNDWWRIQEHQGIELLLMMNNMTMDDVQIVEFPYADDWYNYSWMLEPIDNASELWLKRDQKRDLAFRPLETALLSGVVDAIYNQSLQWRHLQEATGQIKAIEDLGKYPDWTLQVANLPAAITCTAEMAEQHPELVVAYMKAMIKVGRWGNEHKHAAAAILDKQTFYLGVEGTFEALKNVDPVPDLSPQNLACVEIGKDFMLSHGYIKTTSMCGRGRRRSSWSRRPENPERRVEEGHHVEAPRNGSAALVQREARVALTDTPPGVVSGGVTLSRSARPAVEVSCARSISRSSF